MAITFEGYPEITKEEIDRALEFCNEQILHILPEFTDKFQQAYSVNGFYPPIENNYWTCDFYENYLGSSGSGETSCRRSAVAIPLDRPRVSP